MSRLKSEEFDKVLETVAGQLRCNSSAQVEYGIEGLKQAYRALADELEKMKREREARKEVVASLERDLAASEARVKELELEQQKYAYHVLVPLEKHDHYETLEAEVTRLRSFNGKLQAKVAQLLTLVHPQEKGYAKAIVEDALSVLPESRVLRWTTAKPSKAGWWWWRPCPGESHGEQIAFVMKEQGVWCARFNTGNEPSVDYLGGQWSDQPMAEPIEKQEDHDDGGAVAAGA